MKNSKKLSLIILMVIFFWDLGNLFLVFPIYAPLFLKHNIMLAESTSHFIKTFTIGALVASYGLGQFIGGPLLGEISDQYGRKKVIYIGLIAIIFGNLISAISIHMGSVLFLWLSRLLIGFASGNGSVIMAFASNSADTEKQKSLNISHVVGSGALAMILCPLIGSRLSDPGLVSWFNFSTPFYVLAIINVLNLVMLSFFFKDFEKTRKTKLDIFIGIKNIFECLKTPVLKVALLVYFLFVISVESILISGPIFLVMKLKATSIILGNMFSIGGVLSALTSFYFVKLLLKKIDVFRLYLLGIIFLTIGYIAFLISGNLLFTYFSWGIIAIFSIICWGQGNAIISISVDKSIQGKVLGVSQSLLSISTVIASLLMGAIAAIHYNIAVSVSIVTSFFSFLFFVYYWKRKQSNSV